MTRRGTAAMVVAACAALTLSAAPAGAGSPTATASAENEALLSYVTKGKLKPRKRIEYEVVCSAGCHLAATSTVVVKGPDAGPLTVQGTFSAGEVVDVFLTARRATRRAIKEDISASKLRTVVTATNTSNGDTDTDKRTYRFK